MPAALKVGLCNCGLTNDIGDSHFLAAGKAATYRFPDGKTIMKQSGCADDAALQDSSDAPRVNFASGIQC